MALSHEKADVDKLLSDLRAIGRQLRAEGAPGALVRPLAREGDGAKRQRCDEPADRSLETSAPPPGWKRVSFIRHGEGFHNVAQKEWREAAKPGEPYTLDTDPDFRYLDPYLTECGQEQACELRARAAAMSDVEVIVVSPLRRATQTALVAFDEAVGRGVPVVAHELCHEIAGKHTCDKRRSTRQLAEEFPQVDFSQFMGGEEDPYWGDGLERETLHHLAQRGADFIRWLLERAETRVVVASHSTWLLTLFNAVLDLEQPAGDDMGLRTWFATGEMRTVLLGPAAPPGGGAGAGDGGTAA